MRKLREENAVVQGKLVAALQAVQVANAESDALRHTATTAVHDEQVETNLLFCMFSIVLVSILTIDGCKQAHSGAVHSAIQRIQILGTFYLLFMQIIVNGMFAFRRDW